MANVSGTKNDPLKDVQQPNDEPRILPALGEEKKSHQPTELDIQNAQDAISEDDRKKAAKEKLFPVHLLKNYRPLTGEFKIAQPGVAGKNERDPTDEEKIRLQAGTDVLLPLSEAKRAIELKIGERNDPLPGK